MLPSIKLWAFAEETARRAHANYDLVMSNWDNIWPWRWIRWFRIDRARQREHRVIQERSAQLHAWMENHYVT